MRFYLFVLASFHAISGIGQSYSEYVNPFVGTDFNGHTFPGATTPFGMVQLSPDTRIDGSWEGCSGYHYSDSVIYGFSHTHLSGTGVSDYGDILIMPQLGQGSFNNTEYAAVFSHQNERATPGYYNVVLNNQINVELSATKRVGIHRYSFPETNFSIIVDLEHRDQLNSSNIELINDTVIAVSRISSAWAQNQHCYGYIVTSTPFKPVYNEDSTKVLLQFSDVDKQLLIKVGLSFTSPDGARKNLQSELNHWDFNQVYKEANQEWNAELSKIEVNDTPEKLKTFYTALYHVMIHPNIAMDVDGTYRGMDNALHKAEGFDYYTVFSLWDTFRALHPLLTIIDRKRTLDFMKTFIKMYEQGGRLPVWELCSNETDCMIGYHSVSVIADAVSKGIDDFDLDKAYEAMKHSAQLNHFGLNAYMNNGFLFIDDEHESVSKTLEYAYDDWCIAQMAHHLNQPDDYQQFMLRSNSWRNLLDTETKLMRPRKNGAWLSPFDPKEVNNHYTEGNAWQYSFFVPHDVHGMIEEMGGADEFEAHLDRLFNESSNTTGRDQADITGLIGQYAHGNEPSHHMAYLYNYVDKPEKAMNVVHRILNDFYTNEPDGLIGNEDCGQMSAWYVMSAMGLYAVCPGKPSYALCDPYLKEFAVHLENGGLFTQQEIRQAQSIANFASHEDLTGFKSNKWSNLTPMVSYLSSPVVHSSSISFDDSLSIDITVSDDAELVYQLLYDNQEEAYSREYSSTPFFIKENVTVRTFSKKMIDGKMTLSRPIYAKFYKTPHPTWNVRLNCDYTAQYSAGGPRALIDGINGDENWRKGYWQGYQGQNFEVIVDMGASAEINKLGASFLQDTRAWIIFPPSVTFYGSNNGKDYREIATKNNQIVANDYTPQTQIITTQIERNPSYRYIKVVATNYGTLPEWHQGAGYDAYIFVDEVIIE